MRVFAKVIRIIFVVLGFMMAVALTCMLIISGPEGIDSPDLIMPLWAVMTILIAVDVFCVFLFVYNIICLAKGIDVFFWLIFRHQAYVNGDYKKPKEKPTPKSYSSPRPTTSYNTPKPNPTPKPSYQKPHHEFDSYQISNTVKSAGRVQLWRFNAYVEIADVYVKEVGDYEFSIKVGFKVTGSATIKDDVDVSNFKKALKDAQKMLFDRIDDYLHPKYVKYGFGYEIKVTGCSTDSLRVTNY